MSKELRVGVIGCGFIGRLHARVMHELPHAKLVGIADVNEKIAHEVAKACDCAAYSSYNELLSRQDLDAVCICVPEEHHVAPAVAAARAGKHILIEKPIAKTFKEAMEIKSAADAAGVRLMVGHVLRFDPRYVQVHHAIERGEIGTPIHLFLKRTNPVAAPQRLNGRVSLFYYLGVHDIDLMLWYAGCDITRVYAQQVKRNPALTSEDTVMAVFNFANGAIGALELSWALPNNSALGIVAEAEVVGSKGAAFVDIRDQGLQVYTESKVQFPDTLHWPEINGQIVGDLRDELAHFVQATLDGTPYRVPTDSAMKAVKVIEACFESIQTGKPVDVV